VERATDHHVLLHLDDSRENFNYQSLEVFRPVVEHHNKLSGTSGVILSALPVVIKGPLGSVECLAFLDDGSTGTLLEESIAKEVGLDGVQEPFCMKTMTSTKQHADSKMCNLTISGAWEGAEQYCMDGVRTVQDLDLGVMNQDGLELKRKYPYLSRVPLPSFHEKPKMLIGKRHCFYTASRQVVGPAPDQPLALKCRLGWSVGGQLGTSSCWKENCFHICEEKSLVDSRSNEDLKAVRAATETDVNNQSKDSFRKIYVVKQGDVNEIKRFKDYPVKMTQEENFPEELRHLNEGKKWLEIETDAKGDNTVVVKDIGARNNWLQERIVKIHPRNDEITRFIDVKTSVGINRRPTSKIHRLDIRNEDEVPSSRGSM